MKIVDANGLKLGRLASNVAREALKGEQISIVNCEKAVITGRKKDIFATYREKRTVGSRYKGPFFPKPPHMIVRRTIRGMLPYKKATGEKAFGLVKAYIGVPQELEGKKFEMYNDAKLGIVERKNYLTIEEISEHIGWKK